ncbi:MAG: glucosamine-6-phosphate deaminase [Firmicutes bacterium]|nr:glucosamine-6-phosphate deaminase [Bacillota bacterium]
MKKMICKNYDALSYLAANIIAEQIKNKPDTVLGLATGSTPMGTYKELVRRNKKGAVDFSGVTTFNLDEYYKISGDNPQSYHYFMYRNLFDHININRNNIHIPDGNTASVEQECERYDRLIRDAGGIDLQVLGIGSNGHIGFNEPASELITKTHLTALTENTIQDNARFFNHADEVPVHAITMGLGTILKAKRIILLISGKNKAEIFKKAFEGKITTNLPASLLQLHPDTTVIVDEEAAFKLVS